MRLLTLLAATFFVVPAAAQAPAASASPEPTVVPATRVNTSVPVRTMRPSTTLRRQAPILVPNKFHVFGKALEPDPVSGFKDPVRDFGMAAMARRAAQGSILQDFEATPVANVAPPDPSGDVGPNHYVQMVNSRTTIFDRAGNVLVGPVNNNTFWQGLGGQCELKNDGDPIVLYDEIADRWMISQFALNPYAFCVAISATPDPTGAYHQYEFPWTEFLDYPKVGVWPDGYYVGMNTFSASTFSFLYSEYVVLERDQMLQGLPAQSIRFQDTSTSTPLPADVDGPSPPPGTSGLFTAINGGQIAVNQLTPDWTTPSNSTLNRLATLATQPYSSRTVGIPQPGTSDGLDPLSPRGMFRTQYRNRGTHGMLLFNHTVDASGVAGVRWYELRDGGTGTWSIHQQGTYAPTDGLHRWMGSVAMNGNGDIGVGYSVSSSSVFPSIRFAGQTAANSGTGVLDIPETEIFAGTGSQTGTGVATRGVGRWGDYTHLAIDPTDDETFWYTNQYYPATSSFNWRTRVTQFTFEDVDPPVLAVSPGAVSLGLGTDEMAMRDVTITNAAASGAATLRVTPSLQNFVPSVDPFVDSDDAGGPAVAFQDISGTGTALGISSDDDSRQTVSLPFLFPFYGTDRTQIIVSTNGFIAMSTNTSAFGNEPIPDSSTPNGVIAPFWDDLDPSSGGTIYSGTLPDGRFVIQWEEVVRFNTSAPLTFQALLSSDGTIEFQYETMSGTLTSATVGVENDAGTEGIEVAFNEAYVTSNKAVRIPRTPPSIGFASVPTGIVSVEPGDSEALPVSFDSARLPTGTYTADLVLASNDPSTPSLTVPLTLIVNGETATATIEGTPGWRLFAPAATGMTVADLAELNRLSGIPGYDEINNPGGSPPSVPNLFTGYDGTALVAPAGGSDPLRLGEGFWWYLYDVNYSDGPTNQSYALPFTLATGNAPMTSDVDVALHADGDKVNLIGNPFGQSLDLSTAGSWPGEENLLVPIFAIYDSGANSYSFSTTTPVVSAWQGFYAYGETAGTLTIPETARTTGGTLRKGQVDERVFLALELTEADDPADGEDRLADRGAVLYFDELASAGTDPFDLAEFAPVDEAYVSLAFGAEGADGQTVLRGHEGRSPADGDLEIPLHVRAVGASGSLTLSWPSLDRLPDDWGVTLRDLDMGTEVDLREQASYAFDVEPVAVAPRGAFRTPRIPSAPEALATGDASPRFVLLVSPAKATSTATDADAAFALAPPMPNPARERATLRFSLATPGEIALSVFDVQGREVARLGEGAYVAGDHAVVWDTSTLAAGVYVVRLVSADAVLTQRAVVAR
ncbi:MAG: nidogen-like domain-containing protein [Bacteroidota bacterium]